MPHHSGGGSHHGGSHHSSHSHSSHHSSSGAGRSAPPSEPIRRKPYPGARKYIYTHPRTHRQYVYYYKGVPQHASKFAMIFVIIFVGIFFLPFMLGVAVCALDIPVRTDLNSYEHSIVINDSTGIIKNDVGLYEAMEDFQTVSGVTPALIVVYDNEWNERYYDLADYAYDVYVSVFTDEKHWLLTVSVPHSNTLAGNVDWKFEGMIGDDVGKTISRTKEDLFTDLVQANLSSRPFSEITEGIRDAYSQMSERAMKSHINWGFVAIYLFLGAIYVGICAIPVLDYQKHKRLELAAKAAADEAAQMIINAEPLTPTDNTLKEIE